MQVFFLIVSAPGDVLANISKGPVQGVAYTVSSLLLLHSIFALFTNHVHIKLLLAKDPEEKNKEHYMTTYYKPMKLTSTLTLLLMLLLILGILGMDFFSLCPIRIFMVFAVGFSLYNFIHMYSNKTKNRL